MGWAEHTRVDRPEEDVTIFVFDTVTPHDLTFRPRGPATFSLSVVFDGAGTLSVDGAAPLAVAPAMGVLFTSGRETGGLNTIPGGQRVHMLDLRFERRFLLKAGGAPLARLGGDLLSEHSRPDQDVFLVGFPAPAALLQSARDIAACALPEGLSRNLFLYSKAIHCLSVVVQTLGHTTLKRVAVRREDRERVERARAIIEGQFGRDLSIARLAREVGLNERKLKEGFRAVVGNSVHAYLRQVRLDAAATMLEAGATVTETALAVGFDSLSHFSKVFTAAKGVAPSRYLGRT
ncbi:AraC family transcriptional regulator [Chelatococcus reniformis]|uniref:AraC family transcriptional regulator n=1 Tax=Chelatococcus reniformis TaxID=1494448 RepID=A0A916UJ05_9HYPH|nr:AraC family transcriptional regulator [Chelatococcus reniformis]